jgi:hypothetical protein
MDMKLPDSRTLSSSARRLGTIGVRLIEDSIANTSTMARRLGELAEVTRSVTGSRTAGRTKTVPCCPPIEECPPQCLTEITRHAHAGEVVLVAIRINNPFGEAKTWQVGLRPLVDEHQKPAPSQPTLDKTSVTVPPSQSVVVEMRIDLTQGYHAGSSYEATIVIREKEVNQNVCFTLVLDPLRPEDVTPWDEQDLKRHFLSWHHHFYCDGNGARRTAGTSDTHGVTIRPDGTVAGRPEG